MGPREEHLNQQWRERKGPREVSILCCTALPPVFARPTARYKWRFVYLMSKHLEGILNKMLTPLTLTNIPLERPERPGLNSEFLDSWRVLECGSTERASHCLPGPSAYSLFPLCFSSQAVSCMMGGLCTHVASPSSPYIKLLHSIPQTYAPQPCLGLRVVHAAKGLLKMERLGGGVAIWAKNLGVPGTSHGVKKGRWGL